MKTFDYEKALTVVDGDVDLLKELIVLFKEQSPQLLAEIRQAIETGRHEELARAAHTLKGSLASLGATVACEIAQTLETRGTNKNSAGTEEAFLKLSAEIKKFEHKTANLERASA